MSVSGDRAEMGLTKLSSNLNVFLTNFRVMRVWVQGEQEVADRHHSHQVITLMYSLVKALRDFVDREGEDEEALSPEETTIRPAQKCGMFQKWELAAGH